MIIKHKTLEYKTKGGYEFEDITDEVIKFVKQSKITAGFVNIQTLHTTNAIVVNENEPLLIEDMKNNFRELAKKDIYYGHNDFDIRTQNMCGLDECKNGHSHCLAVYLPTSVTLNIIDSKVSIGQWQRVFFIELDHSRNRKIQIQVMGE
ncbi:MAG: secondary thiamine-phosphate synthase enzyme YjbQ [Candidatus Saccharibacteria bacterium]